MIFQLWVLCLLVILWGSIWQNAAMSWLIIVVYVVFIVQIYRKHSLWSGGPWEGGGSCPVPRLEQKPWHQPQPNSPTCAQFLGKRSLPAGEAWALCACGPLWWLSPLLSSETVPSRPQRTWPEPRQSPLGTLPPRMKPTAEMPGEKAGLVLWHRAIKRHFGSPEVCSLLYWFLT